MSRISRHLTRYDWSRLPELLILFRLYAAKLAANGYAQAQAARYAYDYFDNNVRVPSFARSVYRRLGLSARGFGNPFQSLNPTGFYQWLFFPQHSSSGLPRLLHEIYDSRVDIQRAFPDPIGAQRQSFLKWARQFVPLEYGVDPILWHPVLEAAGYR